MDYIKKIEINHFRSINRLVINEVNDINVFSGSNDVGKSNVIKALNLFFENQIDWQTPLNLGRDTNTFHAHRSRWGKVRKSISVKLTFQKPRVPRGRYPRLPDVYWIKRQWDRDYPINPNTTWGAEGESNPRTNWQRALTEFLNRSRFYYVPAIRSQGYFQHLIGQFLEIAIGDSDQEVLEAIAYLAEILDTRTSELRDILYSITGLNMAFELPSNLLNVLRAVDVVTEGNVPLQYRGDGIQSLTVPGLLQYLCGRGRNEFCYWGFEEPENSLEYRRVNELARNLSEQYSKDVQVFLTSHSPAFLTNEDPHTSIFHVMQQFEEYPLTGHVEQTSRVELVNRDDAQLSEVLGLSDFSREFSERFIQKLNERDKVVKSQETELIRIKKPRLIVEGKNDRKTLEHAWERLYADAIPFEIKPASNANEVTNQIRVWRELSDKRVVALYDHDEGGIKAIKGLNRVNTFTSDISSSNYRYTCGEQVLAITLPSPPEREEHAKHETLSMELYFSYSLLRQIDEQPGSEIFSRTNYSKYGAIKHESKQAVQILINNQDVTIENRKIEGPGKDRLVEMLPELPDKEFAFFDGLFTTIAAHLVPEFEFTPRDATPEIQTEC